MAGAPHSHPSDVLVEDLLRAYAGGMTRLEGLVRDGLRRGLDPARLGQPGQQVGDATLAYRASQLAQARAVAAELERLGQNAGPLVVGRAYRAGLVAVDAHVSLEGKVRGNFGTVHVRAVEALAGQMSSSLAAAAARVGTNVETVFARANALDGALPAGGRVGGVPFLGRRADDPYRELGLQAVTTGVIAGDARRAVSAELARRLVSEGVTDALTGFVDKAGRRWSLGRYTAMVARTTTREAMTASTVSRMTEHGLDLVTISSHPHAADECTPYDGNTFSLTGATPGYDVIDELPPFHPFCVHVTTPAAANLDDFEASLAQAAAGTPPVDLEAAAAPPAPARGTGPASARARAGGAPAIPAAVRELPPAPVPDRAGLSPAAQPRATADTLDHLEAQRVAKLIAGDPGPDDGDWWGRLEAEDQAAVKAAAANKRAANRALNDNLGPDLAKFIDRKWGKEAQIRERLLAGELSVEQATDLAVDEYERLERRAAEREVNKSLRGDGAFSCFVCGRKKSRPSDVCEFCGDDPLPLGTSPGDFDRAYGFDQPDVSNANRHGRQRG